MMNTNVAQVPITEPEHVQQDRELTVWSTQSSVWPTFCPACIDLMFRSHSF